MTTHPHPEVRRSRRSTAVVAAAVLAVGLSVIAPAAKAHADTGSCTGEDGPENLGPGIFDVREFSIQDAGDERRFVTVEAVAAMPRADAQKFIDRPGHEAIFRLWGDDQWDDDLIVEFRPEHYWVGDTGLGIRGGAMTSAGALDEDSQPETDNELYVGIRLTDIRDGSERKVETCVITWPDYLIGFDAPRP
jgi:hypothetical protein